MYFTGPTGGSEWNVFQWKAPPCVDWFCASVVYSTCSIIKVKLLMEIWTCFPVPEDNSTLIVLDPARPTWCEVSWSDASLAASVSSKEAVVVSYYPLPMVMLYWGGKLNSEINQGGANTASGCLVIMVQIPKCAHMLSFIALFNGAMKTKVLVADSTVIWLVLMGAKLWMASLSHILFVYMCVCQTHLLPGCSKGKELRLYIKTHCFYNNSLMNDFLPNWQSANYEQRSLCVLLNGSQFSVFVFFLLLWPDCLLFLL